MKGEHVEVAAGDDPDSPRVRAAAAVRDQARSQGAGQERQGAGRLLRGALPTAGGWPAAAPVHHLLHPAQPVPAPGPHRGAPLPRQVSSLDVSGF